MAKSNNINTESSNKNKNKNRSSAAAEAEELTVAPPETEAETQRAGEEEGDDEGDATISEIVNGTLEKKKKKKKEKRGSEKGDEEKGCNCKFPMNRIRRIIKSEGSGVHIAQDSVFLINKASEKFLELFYEEAYARATLDKKKHVEYKHLSSVVSKRKRFDFLSDFVPEKIKAGDALAEMSSAET